MASSKFASWCDARRFGFGLRVCPVSDASVLRVACLQKSLFAVNTPILAWAAGIGGQRRASALPDQPLPKGFVGSQRQAVRVVELGRQLWLRRIAFHATGCAWLWLFCIAALREPQQMVAGREGGQNRHRMDGSGGGRWMTCVCVGRWRWRWSDGIEGDARQPCPPHGASLLGPSRADRPRRPPASLALPSQQSAAAVDSPTTFPRRHGRAV